MAPPARSPGFCNISGQTGTLCSGHGTGGISKFDRSPLRSGIRTGPPPEGSQIMHLLDARQTDAVLDYATLVDALALAVRDYADGTIACPPRMTVPASVGDGLVMCMPCTAPDLIATKLLTIFGTNPAQMLPAIQGTIIACDGRDGRFLIALDGPTATRRRTAALSMLGIRVLARTAIRQVMVIGTGVQATGHIEALRALHPNVRITVQARSLTKAEAYCRQDGGADLVPAGPVLPETGFDVVICATSSPSAVYNAPGRPDRLVIGIGAYRLDMAEIGARTLDTSALFIDDPIGGPGEAGDFVQAGVDWARVMPFAEALDGTKPEGPIVFKTVGCAAWDLAACRLALARHR